MPSEGSGGNSGSDGLGANVQSEGEGEVKIDEPPDPDPGIALLDTKNHVGGQSTESGNVGGSSDVDSVYLSLEKVFGEGATELAITLDENSSGKRLRDDLVHQKDGQLALPEVSLPLGVESKKQKLVVNSGSLDNLSNIDNQKNLKLDQVPLSGCSTGKEQIVAPPGDLQ